MPTMIYNEGRCIRITVADNDTESTFYINKQQIRCIDIPKINVVRVNMGEGPLKELILYASDVSNPAGIADEKLLREYVASIWKEEFADAATAANQEGQTLKLEGMQSLLQDIKTALTVYNPANIFNQPLIMDNSTAGTTYYGYAVAGTAVNAAGWAIKKVVVSAGTTILWTNGNLNLTNVWNNRTNFTYSSITIP